MSGVNGHLAMLHAVTGTVSESIATKNAASKTITYISKLVIVTTMRSPNIKESLFSKQELQSHSKLCFSTMNKFAD